MSYYFVYGCVTEHATKFKDNVKLNDRAGDRHNPKRVVEAVVVEETVVANGVPRVAGIVPQARP